jgi:hypothetical protein
MDFLSRGGDRAPQPAAHTAGHSTRRKHIDWAARTVRIELFVLLTGITLLLVFLSLYLWSGNNSTNSEFDRVDSSKYQAVFLNGGVTSGSVLYSTYFGHITKMTDNYIVLRDVYYLTTDQNTNSQSNQSSNPQLTKLGCQQLHSPYDEMVVSRNQLAFWENLKDDGKVVQAIKEFVKQNPNGPNCSDTSNSNTNPQNSSGSTQNSTNP